MKDRKWKLRAGLLEEFRKGSNASTAAKHLCKQLGRDIVTVRTCQRWFTRFRKGNFSLRDESRPGRPSEVDDDYLRCLLKNNPSLTSVDVGAMLGIHQTNALKHIKRLGFVSKPTAEASHIYSEEDFIARMTMCATNLARLQNDAFLDRLIIGSIKSITYKLVPRGKVHNQRKSNPAEPTKPIPRQVKIQLCCFWDSEGLIYHELLSPHEQLTDARYCKQLEQLNTELQRKRAQRDGVILHHDNDGKHVSKETIRALAQLGWEILPQLAYSTDMTPSEYHLFPTLQYFLDGYEYFSLAEVESAVEEFFASKSKFFYANGIYELPDRWRKVLANDGNYISD